MRTAVLSDIHANLPALEAVLQHIDKKITAVDRIVCLGDIVGYGPYPQETIDLVRERCEFSVLGNHDEAVAQGLNGVWNTKAKQAIEWTRKHLNGSLGEKSLASFLNGLDMMKQDEHAVYVHGTPNFTYGNKIYLFEKSFDTEFEPYWTNSVEKLDELNKRVCFVGHTHQPLLFYYDLKREKYRLRTPKKGYRYKIPERHIVIANVGSVGQPRDGDNRACYVIFDTESNTIQYQRVKYDIKRVAKKIRTIPELDNRLANRLFKGS